MVVPRARHQRSPASIRPASAQLRPPPPSRLSDVRVREKREMKVHTIQKLQPAGGGFGDFRNSVWRSIQPSILTLTMQILLIQTRLLLKLKFQPFTIGSAALQNPNVSKATQLVFQYTIVFFFF